MIKQRVARPVAGKSGGFRNIILLRVGSLAFFVHGFAKIDLGISIGMKWICSRSWLSRF
ncbi:type II toxin-antitoxin system RelE/ParE family toxin [Niveispirillum sp.]|uniref:type II toxin-antitoxin system RelE/ParE family toxin n=1 Tax=Niveispirillum sp. TaxID=1917217 RepID=UPI0025F36264|nr:type II toxin-antitoxin system RelE/ParE family toxin [Niveispirillum sp.]